MPNVAYILAHYTGGYATYYFNSHAITDTNDKENIQISIIPRIPIS